MWSVNIVFAVIVIIAVFLSWVLGVYAVYTYREVEMAKLKQAHEIMERASKN